MGIFDLPQEWTINYTLPIDKELTFHLKPFSFKHTGLFPEQAANWDWFSQRIEKAGKSGREIKVLNLFAYTGGATLAAAAAGAHVTHVDASKGMVTWAKENAVSSGLGDAPLFFLINSYTTGLQPAVLNYMISTVLKKYDGFVTAEEIGIPASSNGLVLPCGASGRWEHN